MVTDSAIGQAARLTNGRRLFLNLSRHRTCHQTLAEGRPPQLIFVAPVKPYECQEDHQFYGVSNGKEESAVVDRFANMSELFRARGGR
jgi:hypothetical protein